MVDEIVDRQLGGTAALERAHVLGQELGIDG